MRKKVLIIGNSAKEYALAKKLAETCEVYVAPGNDGIAEFTNCIDIRPNSAQELLEFVLENSIDITIPVAAESLSSDIVKLFTKHKLQIFAPDLNVSDLLFDKLLSKKIMYKLKIPTPKFGIFEKQNAAADYVKNLETPFVIKTNAPSSAVIITSQQSAKNLLDSFFAEKSAKILVENYVYGTPFGFYAITDGFNALPLGSSVLYKYSLDGEGGQLTSGMGACSPNYKLSLKNEEFIMNNVIYPTLNYLEANGSTYCGIIGVNGILSEDGNVKILGYLPFMQDADCAGILALLDTDLYKLIESCTVGSFSDEFDYIKCTDNTSVSVVLCCKNRENSQNIIDNIDNVDENIILSYTNNVHKNKYLELEAQTGPAIVFTSVSRTHASASKKVYDEIKEVTFSGMTYRKDICKTID